jgi:hypothetical protein
MSQVPLLQTKLYAPPKRPKLVSRRVFDLCPHAPREAPGTKDFKDRESEVEHDSRT